MLPKTFLRFANHLSFCALVAAPICLAQSQADWAVYNGGTDGDHYSRLTQINRDNVHLLQQAWTYDTGEKGGIQTNPLIIGRTLYAYTPRHQGRGARCSHRQAQVEDSTPASSPANRPAA